MHSLKKGKAVGIDNSTTDYLPVDVHLKLLFYIVYTYEFVPDDLGAGHRTPTIKDKLGNVCECESTDKELFVLNSFRKWLGEDDQNDLFIKVREFGAWILRCSL